jgi:predicted amidohydrolase YtcJ
MRVNRMWLVITLTPIVFSLSSCSSSPVSQTLSRTASFTPPPNQTQALSSLNTEITAEPSEPADIIFYHGNIITIEKDQPLVEAVAIRGNLIQAVGSDEEMLTYRGQNTELIDLKGNTLMPGFEEGHVHAFRNTWGNGDPIQPLMDDLLAFGWTSVTEMHSTDDFINAMLEVEKNDQLKLRMNIFAEYNCGFLENGKSIECPSWYLDNPPILDPSRMVRIPGVKIFLDGAGGNRGCPYNSFQYPDNIEDLWPGIWDDCTYPYGDLYLTEEQLTPVLQDIQNRGYRAAFHIMGDAAIDVALNTIETVLNGKSNLDIRYQIEHNSALRPDQLDRYVEMNMIAMIPGYLNSCEADELRAMYGEAYYPWYVNRFALPGLGAHTFSSSDFNAKKDIHQFGLAINPALQIYGMVTRKQFLEEGKVCDPPEWMAHYRISVEQALQMLTIEPAFAVSMEDYIGSIKPGKFADLIILSNDPLTMNPDELYTLTTWMTMVNGKAEYCASGKNEFCPTSTNNSAVPSSQESATNATSIQVKYDCDNRAGSPIHIGNEDFLLTTIGWAVKTEEQINDFKDALNVSMLVNKIQIPSGIDFSGSQEKDGMYVVQVIFNVGDLQPGQYEVQTILTFDRKVYDGYEWYGPETQYPTIEGTCTVIIDK